MTTVFVHSWWKMIKYKNTLSFILQDAKEMKIEKCNKGVMKFRKNKFYWQNSAGEKAHKILFRVTHAWREKISKMLGNIIINKMLKNDLLGNNFVSTCGVRTHLDTYYWLEWEMLWILIIDHKSWIMYACYDVLYEIPLWVEVPFMEWCMKMHVWMQLLGIFRCM